MARAASTPPMFPGIPTKAAVGRLPFLCGFVRSANEHGGRLSAKFDPHIALPTLLRLLRISTSAHQLQFLHQALIQRGEILQDAFSGGASAIGFVVSITIFLQIIAVAYRITSPLPFPCRSTTISANAALPCDSPPISGISRQLLQLLRASVPIITS